MKRVLTIAITFAILSLVPAALAASGTAGKSAATGATGHTGTTGTTGKKGTAALSGTYKKTINSKTLLAGRLNGVWQITLKTGTYAVTQNGKAAVNGKFTTSGSVITITDTGGPAKCKGTGKYTYKAAGKSLTFKKVTDTAACIGRTDVLTSGAWTKA